MAGGPASGEGVFDLNRIGLECGMRSTSKGDMSSERELVVGWLVDGFHQWAAIRDAFLPAQPTIPQLVPCLSPPPPHSRGWPATVVVLGSVSHGHSVYISSAPESRSPSLHSRPKVAHSQRLMYVTAHLRNRASYGSQTEILLTQPHTIESWRRERSGGAQFLQRIDGDCFSYY